jgi:TPR repeat protein
VPGVRYEELKEAAAQAIEICGVAKERFPSELRYTYQYARALGFSEPEKAIVIYRKLTRQSYPAAFDNLGSLLLQRKDRKSFNEAINVFNEGVRIGDPDSMVTLSALIVRGYYRVENPYDYSLKLLRDAAALGHPGAKRD